MKKKLKTREGITLIALIITIIVMLILVAVTINMAINGGLFEKAGKAAQETQNTINQEQDIANGGVTIDGKNYNSIDEYINREEEYVGLTITSETEGVVFTKSDGATPGDANNIETGDIVIYGDYEYHYNQIYATNPFFTGWNNDSELDGWGVKVLDRSKTEYGELCGSIFGKSLKNTDYLFGAGMAGGACTNLTTSPKIPANVVSMDGTFQKCSNLLTAPVIPSNVISMGYVFAECSNLEGNITINANPAEYSNWISSSKLIVLTGNSTMLETLAEGHSNITIQF